MDVSRDMLDHARAHCADMPWVEFLEGNIEKGVPLPDESFDLITAASVLQHVDEMDAALGEIARLLRPRGQLLIHDTEWDSMVWYSRNRARMKKVLAVWRGLFANPHFFQTLGPKLKKAGFAVIRKEAHPTFFTELQPHATMFTGLDIIAEAVAGKGGITRAEAGAWAKEQRELGEEGGYFSCVSRFLFLAMKVGDAG